MLNQVKSYEEACRTFRWRIPERYNVAFDICDRQTMAGSDGHRTALIVEHAGGAIERYTFHVLRLLSNRLANVLSGAGISKGDRVLVSFGQSVEAAVALLAILRLGAIAVPVPVGLGTGPLSWRLADSGAAAALVHPDILPRLLAARKKGMPLTILVSERAQDGCEEMWAAMERAPDSFATVVTESDDPAFLFYPPHAAGKPAGVLHAHRVLPGNLPPVEMALGFFPQGGDIFWTSAEWMSFEGLIWAVLPAWHHAVPVVAGPGNLTAEQQLPFLGRHGVRALYAPHADLMALATAGMGNPHPLPRAIATGPQLLTAKEQDLVTQVFEIQGHEIWGIPETGAVAANLSTLLESYPGSPGKAAPGVTVEAVDGHGQPMRAGERGMLALAPGAPGGYLRHWRHSDPSRARLPSGWLMTGYLGQRDLDGYLWPEFPLAAEGEIAVGGYRVLLADVQATLVLHPKVAAAAVLDVGGSVKAFVVPASGVHGDVALAQELQSFVAVRRATHEAPRRIEFVDKLPTDKDGKLQEQELLNRPIRLDGPSAEDRLTYRGR